MELGKMKKNEGDDVAKWFSTRGRGRKPPALLGFSIQSSNKAPKD